MRPYNIWPADQSASLKMMVASGISVADATASLNAEFGTNRSFKSCANHLFDDAHRTARSKHELWTPERDARLLRLLATHTYAQAARVINEQFGTHYTRNALIGRANRLNGPRPPSPRPPGAGQKELSRRQTARRREKRWAADPSLEERYKRQQAQAANRTKSLALGHSKTSRNYRVHLPKVANMTKAELRAMLSQAVQNTAAMGIAA